MKKFLKYSNYLYFVVAMLSLIAYFTKKDMDNNKLIGDIHKAINLNNSSEYLEHIFALEERTLATSATIETILAKIGKRIEDGK